MWSGTSALNNIDKGLQSMRSKLVRLDTQLSQLTRSLADRQRHRLKIINDIARVRLASIESGEIDAALSAADTEVTQLLARREQAFGDLDAQTQEANERIAALEDQRAELLQSVNTISQSLADMEHSVQAALQQDSDYMARLESAREAQSVSDEAHHKAEQAQADLAKKAEPYKADALFMYLWQRGYGTTDYKANPLARFLDGRVARLIQYSEARVNYWNLTEIPKRLSEHADQVARNADEAHMALQQLELNALEAAGKPSIEANLQQAREDLDAKDDEVEQAEANLNELLQGRARFMAGQDDYMVDSLKRLTQALEHQDLHAVHRYVRDTHSPTDDQLVLELQDIDNALVNVEDDLDDLRNVHDSSMARLKELERVRRKFKDSRFDDVRSGFENQSVLLNMLAQFLNGGASGKDLWRVIKRNQRYRNVGTIPDFGSDGLGSIGDILGPTSHRRQRQSKRNSSWHWPKPRRGGGGFRLPRAPRSGGGGFKTGGSF